METVIARLTASIHTLADRVFNISSPQQQAEVLFDDLKLAAPVRYGKGKQRSTAAEILEELAPDHEIVRMVLEYRQLTKLKGTYVDALPALIDARTGRLHTSFNQAGAATGRLSSSNPNLQNIPIRTALGREIRAAFVPREGWKLLVADYSQIELRLLAHMSDDPLLLEAFRNGEDIHTRTASEVLGVPPMLVTPDARRDAKAVNFGIVYGISAFGLAAQLGIGRGEAEKYIKNYFARYAGVRRFIDETIAEVRRTGVARTLFGRERPIPDINARNPNVRGFAERVAVNSPLQGTAADLIKLAMVRIARGLEAAGRQSAMLLQVHDELVFECPPEEVEAAARELDAKKAAGAEAEQKRRESLAVVDEDRGGIVLAAAGQHQLHHQRGHEGAVRPVEPEQVAREIGIVTPGDQPPVTPAGADVVADRAALAQHQVAVGDHRGDPHRVQRLVIIGGEAVVRPPLVALERVVEPQLLAQPHDPFGLGDPQVVNRQHVRASSFSWPRRPRQALAARTTTPDDAALKPRRRRAAASRRRTLRSTPVA